MSSVADERPDDFVEPPPSGETSRSLVLVIVCLAQFMVILDATVVNVALPSIQADLGFSAEPPVGHQQLHADLRRLPAARRRAGHLSGAGSCSSGASRSSASPRSLTGSRPAHVARRGARAAGARRRARLPRRAVDHHDQQILGYSPLEAGLAFLPVTVGIGVGAAIAQQLVKRIGVRTTGRT